MKKSWFTTALLFAFVDIAFSIDTQRDGFEAAPARPHRQSWLHACLLAILALLLTATITPIAAASPNHTVETQSIVYQQAKAAAMQNNAALVEQTLAATIVGTHANSAAWHIQLGQKLLSVVFDVPREGRCDILQDLVALARNHHEAAFAAATSASERATLKVQLAQLHERYRGDRAAAKLCYREALAIMPSHTYAQRAIVRLARADEIIRERRAYEP